MATKTIGKQTIMRAGGKYRYDDLMHEIGDFISGLVESYHEKDGGGAFEAQTFAPDADYIIILKKKDV